MEPKEIEVRTLFLSVATVFSIELAMRAVISKGLLYPMVILGWARLLEIILIILIVLMSRKGLSPIGLARSKIGPGIKRGLIWSAGFGLVSLLGFVILFIAGINALTHVKANLPASPNEITLYLLVGGLMAPVAEEVFFRGILYGFFRRWGVIVALVLSTLIFVLTHPISQGFPITQVVGGIVFAVAYEIEGSLMVPIIIHSLGNTAIFSVSLFL